MQNNELYGERGSTSAEKREHQYSMYAKRITDIGSDQRIKLDYVDRTDDNPTYVGRGAKGLATSSDGWLVHKITYDSSNRIIDLVSNTGSWDNRVSLF